MGTQLMDVETIEGHQNTSEKSSKEMLSTYSIMVALSEDRTEQQ